MKEEASEVKGRLRRSVEGLASPGTLRAVPVASTRLIRRPQRRLLMSWRKQLLDAAASLGAEHDSLVQEARGRLRRQLAGAQSPRRSASTAEIASSFRTADARPCTTASRPPMYKIVVTRRRRHFPGVTSRSRAWRRLCSPIVRHKGA